MVPPTTRQLPGEAVQVLQAGTGLTWGGPCLQVGNQDYRGGNLVSILPQSRGKAKGESDRFWTPFSLP